MSCIFCDSVEHLTQYCDKYVTDDERNSQLLAINTCKHCKSSYDKYYTFCIKCEPITKCFSCFSRQHHTFFCPVRENHPPKWFIPKIDQDLLTRFFKTFDPLEQYSMVLLAPETVNFISLKKVEVRKFLCINLISEFSNDDDTIVVVDGDVSMRPTAYNRYAKKAFDSNANGYRNFIEAVSKKQLFFKAQNVTLQNSILSHENFSYFLSPITKILHCCKLTLTSTVTFAEILKKMPNLEDLSFTETNVKMGNEWVEDLKIHGKNIKKLKIQTNNFYFNAKELAKIIKRKNAQIHICLNESTWENVYSLIINSGLPNYFSLSTTEDPGNVCYLRLYRNASIFRDKTYFLKPL